MIHRHELSLMKLHLWVMDFSFCDESTNPGADSAYMVSHWTQRNLEGVQDQQILKLNDSHSFLRSSVETSVFIVFPWKKKKRQIRTMLSSHVRTCSHKLRDYSTATLAQLHYNTDLKLILICIYVLCFSMLTWGILNGQQYGYHCSRRFPLRQTRFKLTATTTLPLVLLPLSNDLEV